MPNLRYYNIFISHAWKYGDEYNRLVNLLNSANNFIYKNYSAPEGNPLKTLSGNPVKSKVAIAEAIDRKIANSQIILVISGMYANNREWMNYEIESAKGMKKPIIAIKPWGHVNTPSYVQLASKETVGWNTDSIIDAIRKYSL